MRLSKQSKRYKISLQNVLKNFKSTLMLTGVNDSSKEDKFVSGAYKLVEGEHLTDKDHNQILMHEDLAKRMVLM